MVSLSDGVWIFMKFCSQTVNSFPDRVLRFPIAVNERLEIARPNREKNEILKVVLKY